METAPLVAPSLADAARTARRGLEDLLDALGWPFDADLSRALDLIDDVECRLSEPDERPA